MKRIPIVIDTDPGQDDAAALWLALAHRDALDLRFVASVAGNVDLDKTTANALRVLDAAVRPDVAVHRGAERPLVYDLETADYISGPDGLAGAGLPMSPRAAQDGHAVDALIAALRAAPEPGLTLCPLGPLTNLALAFRLAPELLGKVERIVTMGGAIGLGNVTPAAEFNIYVDPHAAAIVYGSGRPIVMFGLGVTLQALAAHDQIERFRDLGRCGRSLHGMLTRPRPGGFGADGHPMHDLCVIAWLLWPELFSGRDCHVDIERGAGPQRGRTTIDWNGRTKRAPNAQVIATVQARELFERVLASFARLP